MNFQGHSETQTRVCHSHSLSVSFHDCSHSNTLTPSRNQSNITNVSGQHCRNTNLINHSIVYEGKSMSKVTERHVFSSIQ